MRITGSRVHRVWKCPASAVLPQLEGDDGKFEPARARGKAIHAYLERVRAIGKADALAEAPEDLRPLLEALDLDNLPVHLATEVAFAWNWRDGTARELGRNMDRGYDTCDPPVDWGCEIPCTIDVVGVGVESDHSGPAGGPGHAGLRRGYGGDYKSGHVKYPAPDQFGQTLLAALCVRAVFGCDDVVVELIHIHDNGSHHAARRTVNEWDLDVFASELQAAMEHVTFVGHVDGAGVVHGDATVPVEGSWCEYCPAWKACPAKIALVRAIPQELVQLGVRPDPESEALTTTPGALTVRNAAAAWMAIERIEDVFGRMKQEIIGIASFEEVPLPDGRVIGYTPGQDRKHANGKVAAELIEKWYGREEVGRRVELSITMANLRLAVSSNLKAGEKIETKAGTGVYDRMLAELERLGGLEIKTVGAGVKPHVPKKKR